MSAVPVRIGWCTATEHCSDLLFDTPEPVCAGIPCPAIGAWSAQGYVLRAPYDVHLAIERIPGGARLRWLQGAPRNDVYESFAVVPESLWPAPDTPIIMWDLRNLFVADQPTMLESIASFLHDEARTRPGTVVPQRFPLAPARPLNWPFLWQNLEQPLHIRRGEPLQYVRFHGKAFETQFRLEAIAWSAAVLEVLSGRLPPAALLPPREPADDPARPASPASASGDQDPTRTIGPATARNPRGRPQSAEPARTVPKHVQDA